jgi:poly-gamma-glutamate synthesis protein (capsule biosynthesis protein)
MLTFLACGDVGPVHEPLDVLSELVRPTLAAADICFGQVERVYSTRGALQLHSGGSHTRLAPHMASVFKDCGFNVLSVASNHAMDWGYDALEDSIATLRQVTGAQVIGAGRNLEEATRPALFERDGVRVAILAYCSILNEGYAAGKDKPGVAPLRANTYYKPIDYQAGMPPAVISIPYEEDLRRMCENIADAKRNADVVIVSHHWGVHFIPRLIADYQVATARAAFDAGADMIVGHHAHVPKAIGVHGGKTCFYSLSNFIMSMLGRSGQSGKDFERKYGIELDPDYPYLAYGKDAKLGLIAKALIDQDGVQRTSFLPVRIDTRYRPEILRAGDARFDEMVAYMEWASRDFEHRFTVSGDEVIVSAPAA